MHCTKQEMLTEAISKLTPRQREAIYLRFSKEMDYKAIAGIMEISVESCRNLISRAINTMKIGISGKGQNPVVMFIAGLIP
jgi:RNA polymerase sigma factor (sigma-70 family)